MVGEDAEADESGEGINGINEGIEAGIDWGGWEGGCFIFKLQPYMREACVE
jgi:hypothetical protein